MTKNIRFECQKTVFSMLKDGLLAPESLPFGGETHIF